MKGATSENYDFMVKLLIIGDSTVGKSALMNKFCDDNFSKTHIATIGVDFKYKNLFCDDKKVKLQIWDTAGQEKFRSIMKTYYKGATGIILTYSIADRKSFQNVENWLKQIQIHASADVNVVLVGNKCDITERDVTTAEGQQLAQKHSLEFFETSAKEGNNVNEVFYHLAKVIKTKQEENPALLRDKRIMATNGADLSGANVKLGQSGKSERSTNNAEKCNC